MASALFMAVGNNRQRRESPRITANYPTRFPGFCHIIIFNMVNIGQDIKNELARQERNVSWLARKLGCNRTAVYRIMQKNSIDTALLRSISIILQHNFFKPLEEETEERLHKTDTEV